MGTIYDGIEEAPLTFEAVYVIPGIYKVKINYCKEGTNRKNMSFVVVDMFILESNNPERPVGTNMSWMIMAHNDSFLSNFKQFISVAGEIDPKEIQVSDCQAITSDDNPLAGAELKIRAWNHITKEGKDFTRVYWYKTDVDVSKLAPPKAQSEASFEDGDVPF